jgi:hypothetical protein
MPKERLHLLLADQSLRLLQNSGLCEDCHQEGYLLASIFPDTFFYDLPFFKHGAIGTALHRYEGKAAVDFFGAWLREEKNLERDLKYWMLGFSSHMLADGLMHPLINGFCERSHVDLELSFKSCHHWLESELEAYWLQVLGPEDGYLPLLKQNLETDKVSNSLDYFGRFLVRAGLVKIPPKAAIRRCFAWQTRLLQIFVIPNWSQVRPWLLRRNLSKYWGSLLVPKTSSLCLSDTAAGRNQNVIKLCSPEFMARTISHLATHLHELLVQF